MLSNVYEGLVGYGKDLKIVPLLATDWKQTAPTVWRFNLRKGVVFHDGTPFTADDVIFSYERAKAPASDMKTYVGSIKEVRKVNDHAVDFITDAPNPILPNMFVRWLIMPKKWCVDNKASNRSTSARGSRTSPRSRRTAPARSASGRATGQPHRAGAQRQLLGQARDQHRRGRLHADRQPVDTGGGADLGRDRHDGAVPVQDAARINAAPGWW